MVDLTGVSRLLEMLLSNTNKEVELRSKRFWRMFGVKRRTEKTIQCISQTLMSEGIKVIPLSDKPFGKEDYKAFLKLKYFSVVYPDDDWFIRKQEKNYESETEVLFYYVKPILLALGYEEPDFSFHRAVHQATPKGRRGVRDRSVRKIPDLVLYNGSDRSPDNALIIVETKMFTDDPGEQDKRLHQAIGDIRYYWITLHSKLGVATDGDQVIVFDPKDQPMAATCLVLNRSQLKENWAELTMLLSKQALV